MPSTMRSDSYSEPVAQEAQALTAPSIIENRRVITIGNVHRGSVYYPADSEVSLNTRSINTSSSM
jgi:hypothetical protein